VLLASPPFPNGTALPPSDTDIDITFPVFPVLPVPGVDFAGAMAAGLAPPFSVASSSFLCSSYTNAKYNVVTKSTAGVLFILQVYILGDRLQITVRPMLWDRYPLCLSVWLAVCLSVTLVYCSQRLGGSRCHLVPYGGSPWPRRHCVR